MFLEQLKDKKYSVEEEHEVLNDGIGPYEYWGYKYNDVKPDYIEGYVQIIFEEGSVSSLREEYELEDEYNDLVKDIFNDNVYGSNIEIDDVIFQLLKEKLSIVFKYYANEPE